MTDVVKVTGPPGCGKTTYILRQIKRACAKYFPNKIGAISYTTAAVEELRAAIVKAADLKDVGRNVRTIHAHCFKLLGLRKEDVADSHLDEFSKAYPQFAMKWADVDTPDDIDFDINRNDQRIKKLFSDMQVYRNRLIPKDKWPDSVKSIANAWFEWMKETGYTDFTGMLEQVLQRELAPSIEILFVDESQDLTPLQLAVTEIWARETDKVIFAGDSDQAIFRYTGTVPEVFINLKAETRIPLKQSYRVSPAVHAFALKAVSKARNREQVEYQPTDKYGPGQVCTAVVPDLSLPGTHMILCRCQYQVMPWLRWLMRAKKLWHNPYRPQDLNWNPCSTQSWKAAVYYRRLMGGYELTPVEFKAMVSKLKANGNLKRGYKARIELYDFDRNDKIDVFDLENFGFTKDFIMTTKPVIEIINVSQRIGDIFLQYPESAIDEKPAVIVGTVHSVKGGEADHVWLDLGLTPTIYSEINRDALVGYDEARIVYVAITRARQTVGVLIKRNINPFIPV